MTRTAFINRTLDRLSHRLFPQLRYLGLVFCAVLDGLPLEAPLLTRWTEGELPIKVLHQVVISNDFVCYFSSSGFKSLREQVYTLKVKI